VPAAKPGFSDFESGDKRWRGFVLPVPEKHWVIWVGERDDVRLDLIDRIVRHTLFPFLLGGLALALLVWAAIGWGLRPLQNMAAVIRARRRLWSPCAWCRSLGTGAHAGGHQSPAGADRRTVAARTSVYCRRCP
jgi:hypothetical protein